MPQKSYQKYLGLFHHPNVQKEIATLDALHDCQRIAKLLYCYEFSFDFTRGLEAALFYTYASQPVAQLLDHTQELSKHTQKRLEDTTILLASFIEHGWESDLGQRAIGRMNKTHGHYRIANDDFIFVLWTFIHFPIAWCQLYGRRPLTDHEQRAWFNFWYQVAQQMQIQNIPPNKMEMDRFIQQYENKNFIYTPASRNVMDATIDILAELFPKALRPALEAVIFAMIPNDAFFHATGYQRPTTFVQNLVRSKFKAYGKFSRWFAIGHYPLTLNNRHDLKHRHKSAIESIRPKHLKQLEKNAATPS